ncbi:MAG TPA: alpha-L-arabinofuranosidase C-terminal domain-containing protein [Streptosporangiaceae bacterium]|nr:alpha-L-arabinofuranosidase C-terminal domain-containing protein [Streptosporangiaceae bacterium]
MTERPIGLVDPGIFGGFAGACPEGDLWAAVRDLGATSMRWTSRPDKPWCGEAEPVLCLDMAGSTLEDVLTWVEYCSGTYGVRYWGLGREMYDGRRTAAEYVAQARRWAKALRRLDPGLRLISCGRTGLDDWDRDVIDGLASHVDLHGIHFYTGSADYWSHILAPHYAERALSVAGALIDRARYVQHIEREIYVACDEWGLRSGVGQALADMLAAATYLNVFVRQSWTVRMAHLALTVPVGASSDGEFTQGVYHPFQLMASASLPVAVDTFTSSGTHAHRDPPGEPYRVADLGRFQLLDVAATADPARSRLTVSVVNRDPRRVHPTRVTLHDARASGVMTVHEVTGTVRTVKHEVSGEHVDVTFAPRSFTLLELPLA